MQRLIVKCAIEKEISFVYGLIPFRIILFSLFFIYPGCLHKQGGAEKREFRGLIVASIDRYWINVLTGGFPRYQRTGGRIFFDFF